MNSIEGKDWSERNFAEDAQLRELPRRRRHSFVSAFPVRIGRAFAVSLSFSEAYAQQSSMRSGQDEGCRRDTAAAAVGFPFERMSSFTCQCMVALGCADEEVQR